MLETIKNALKTPEIRKKLLYTLILIIIFRIGCFITLPGVNAVKLNEIMSDSSNGIQGLINMISGGAFSRFSIFAMTIGPYITSSIIMQLLTMIVPALEKLQKDGGEEGKKKMSMYTKIVTIILAAVEALGIYLTYRGSDVFVNPGFLTGLIIVSGLMAGTAILVWLGEEITNKGIGNGISMIIFIGIVSGLPGGITTIYNTIITGSGFSTTGFVIAMAILAGALLLVAGVVWVQEAERRIPVQYAKKVVGRKMYGGQNTHIPLKLAMAGVMPVIFASSIMTFPATIIGFFVKEISNLDGVVKVLYYLSAATSSSDLPSYWYSVGNALIYLLLIVGFTFFYTMATFNPAEVANNIKRNGGFIPGIRAGKPTAEYLSSVLSKIIWFGAIFLAVIAILPIFMKFTGINISFGGTSILIVVGVALETIQQLESQLVMRHYKGFLE